MDAKICGKCKLLKFDDEFYNDFAKSDNKAWSCKGCSREAKQTDCYKHQQHYRNIKFNYGIDSYTYDSMLINQLGRCFICNRQDDLAIDHDHKTGKIRKLLCMPCNIKIGWLEKHKLFLLEYLI